MDLNKITEAAALINGWHVVGLTLREQTEGTLPSGVVIFEREQYPIPDKPFGVAAFADRHATDEGIYFYSGSYDLDEADAVSEFSDRVRRLSLARIEREEVTNE